MLEVIEYKTLERVSEHNAVSSGNFSNHLFTTYSSSFDDAWQLIVKYVCIVPNLVEWWETGCWHHENLLDHQQEQACSWCHPWYDVACFHGLKTHCPVLSNWRDFDILRKQRWTCCNHQFVVWRCALKQTISSLITLKTLSFVCPPWKTVFFLCLEHTCRLIFEGVLSKNYVLKQKKKTFTNFILRSAAALQQSSASSSFATTIFTPLELLSITKLENWKIQP